MLDKIEKDAKLKNTILKSISDQYKFNSDKKIILVTGHRRKISVKALQIYVKH